MRLRWLVCVASGLVLTACADLGAVSNLSQGMITAGETWNSVGDELPRSCARTLQFNATVDCASSKDAAKASAAATEVLLAYFQAIHDVANESNFTVQPGLDAVAGSVKDIPGVNADQAAAVAGLASTLAKLATEKLREDTLKRLIGEGAPHVTTVLSLLRATVPRALGTTLSSERIAMQAAYASYIGAGGHALPSSCDPAPRVTDHSGETFLLAEDYCRRLVSLDAKVGSVKAYEASLASVQKAMDDLQSDKARLSSKALAQKLYETGKGLDQNLKAVRKAFGKETAA